tara:strand:+ start:288 stop:686 length:399 start_codon:yes stop_codon:yes gene_type:complete
MNTYKIHINQLSDTETEYFVIRNNKTWIPRSEGNRAYRQFIQDVAEQGYDIVKGPDVKSPSYAELRIAEYPSREEQFDMQFHDQVNGTTTWRDTIQAIKDRYPKTITGSTTIGPIPDWVQEAVNAYSPEPYR